MSGLELDEWKIMEAFWKPAVKLGGGFKYFLSVTHIWGRFPF